MNTQPIGAFSAQPEDEGRANRIAARKHLRLMDAARRDLLEAEWAAGEAAAADANNQAGAARKHLASLAARANPGSAGEGK